MGIKIQSRYPTQRHDFRRSHQLPLPELLAEIKNNNNINKKTGSKHKFICLKEPRWETVSISYKLLSVKEK